MAKKFVMLLLSAKVRYVFVKCVVCLYSELPLIFVLDYSSAQSSFLDTKSVLKITPKLVSFYF